MTGSNGPPARFSHLKKSGKIRLYPWLRPRSTNGDVWIGDREDYRIFIYNKYKKYSKFVRTLAMRNRICATTFDKLRQPWIATGHEGQLSKIDRDGNVLGAIGHRYGNGPTMFSEMSNCTKDAGGHVFVLTLDWAASRNLIRLTPKLPSKVPYQTQRGAWLTRSPRLDCHTSISLVIS
jgi:hypothetical protein